MSLRVMFVDMDAYFASVEQQDRPELRGRPVAVAAVPADSTCCIAVSYEAKRAGVRGGTPVWRARELCPQIRVVQARPRRYVQCHHEILRAVGSCVPVGGVESVDEMWCPLSDAERDPPPAAALARRVKLAVRARVGEHLRCSIGLAPNKFLAKVASDMRKPDGLTVITAADLPHVLHPLRLDDLPGIGPRMFARLRRRRVLSVAELCALPKPQMVKIWGGVVGEYWWHNLRGETVVHRPQRRRTVGHSHVLPPDHRTADGARAVLIRLIHRAAQRLRRDRYWARRMEVYVSFTHREEGWRGEVALGLCQDTLSMIEAFNHLWQFRPAGERPTQVAITLFDLTADACATLPLFPKEQDRVRLARVVDTLNDKLGPNRVLFGSVAEALHAAPTRIAFNRVPEPDDPDYEDVQAAAPFAGWGGPNRSAAPARPAPGPPDAAWWQR